MRRLAVVAALLLATGGVLSGPSPVARAHDGHEYGLILEPPADAEAASGVVRIRGRIFFPEGVRRWLLEVRRGEGETYQGFGTHEDHESQRRVTCAYPYPEDGPSGPADRNQPGSPDGDQKVVAVDCDWDTRSYGNGDPSSNGTYEIVLTAWAVQTDLVGAEPAEAHSGSAGVVVANPAAPPQRVVVGFSEETGHVSLNWAPNAEPDLTGYVVQERFGDREWATVGEPGRSSPGVVRQPGRGGTYRYRVAAARPRGTKGRILSDWAAPVEGPDPLVVPDRDGGLVDATAPPEGDDSAPPEEPTNGGVSNDASLRAEPGFSVAGEESRVASLPGSVEESIKANGNLRKEDLRRTYPPDPETGFSESLPYDAATPPPSATRPEPEVAAPLTVTSNRSRGLAVVPIAGGLLLFVLALVGFLLARLARQAPGEAPKGG